MIRRWMMAGSVGLMLLTGCGGDSDPELRSIETETAAATSENGAAAVSMIANGITAVDAIVAVLSRIDTSKIDTEDEIICSDGGSVIIGYDLPTITGNADLSADFSDCREGDAVLNGSIHLLAAFDGEYFKGTFRDTFTIVRPSERFEIAPGSSMETRYSSRSGSYSAGTVVSSLEWDYNALPSRFDALKMAFTEDGESGIETRCFSSGTIVIDAAGAALEVDENYGCDDPFTFDGGDLVSGSMRLIGSDGTVDVAVTSDNWVTVTGTTAPLVLPAGM